MKLLLLATVVPVAAIACALLAAIAFGGPREPAPMATAVNPFRSVDYTDLPALSRYVARDGASLAYRPYPADPASPARGSIVLVHGSSAASHSMHVLARAFARAGYAAFALDIRGHGESSPRGTIDHVGQLEEDLEDFCRAVSPAMPSTLAGFSSGGGFAVRVAGSARQSIFTNYLLLSPFLGPRAPSARSNSGGWVSVGVPRYVALGLLDSMGIRAFNDLPVLRFALDEAARKLLTPSYSFTLAENFQPHRDYRADVLAISRPVRLVAGQDDEMIRTERFAETFDVPGRAVPIVLLPGVAHLPLVILPAATEAAVNAVRAMNAGAS